MDPETLLDYYKGVDINSTTFFSNAVSIRRSGTAREWSSLGKPVDRDEWGMTVPTV
jgi:endothelin-converting enzyme